MLSAVVEFAYGELAREPRRVGRALQRELVGTYGTRRGTYRLLYRVDEEAQRVYVLRVAHRAGVYPRS